MAEGCVAVMPTDTIYGVLGSALQPKVVERIYKLRRRRPDKPFIILILGMSDIQKFDVNIRMSDIRILKRFWPGPVSVILPLGKQGIKKFRYLHRGTGAIAFRIPKLQWLRELLAKTGPLVAPSANPEGQPPAQTISQAQKYFGDRVDFYLDGGRIAGKPSILVEWKDDKIVAKRRVPASAGDHRALYKRR